ncbi:MAG: imidazolonepropionase [Deltaproteobacteria bacterium]|nr:imidazolonepropionase [Myxococcales bacterium]MDP3214219.1 imidazolonepropionase [Deltaproteobacteria bacterium]
MRVAANLLLRHARELLTCAGRLPPSAARADFDPAPLGLIEDGAVAIADDRIVAVGRTAEVERAVSLTAGATVIDVGDAMLTPGLVDAHTHALFVGHRAGEFSLRVQGAGYAEIAAKGGGIAASVRALRAASDEALRATLARRLDAMARFGTTTVEVKSGYALETGHELRSLKVARSMGERVVPTFLGLHAVPPELRGTDDGRARYLATVAGRMLDAVVREGDARFIDAYVDGPGFSVAECAPTLERARALGLRARLHVGQFEDVGGAELAAALGAASADHLEHVGDAGLRAMAAAGVTAVLLPGAAFSLGQAMPDARRMRALGVAVALATDNNPGTSHCDALPLMAAFGVRQMGLSTVEAWFAITAAAAECLDLGDRGRLVPGARADVAVLDLPGWEALPYMLGSPRALATVSGGVLREWA